MYNIKKNIETAFYEYPYLIRKIQNLLWEGHPVMISSPPKSGKTVLLALLFEKLTPYCNPLYMNAENDTKSIDDYYLKIQCALFKNMERYFRPHIIYASKSSYLRQPTPREVYEELFQMLLCYKHECQIVIMVDNYSSILKTIYSKNSIDGLLYFLGLEQKLRNDLKANNIRVQFVYTSSSSLDDIVDRFKFDRKLIDLSHFQIPTLSVLELIGLLFKFKINTNFNVNEKQIYYLCKQIPLMYPQNFKLAYFEILQICVDNHTYEITEQIMDQALERLYNHPDYIRPNPVRKKVVMKVLNGSKKKSNPV